MRRRASTSTPSLLHTSHSIVDVSSPMMPIRFKFALDDVSSCPQLIGSLNTLDDHNCMDLCHLPDEGSIVDWSF